jgi:hexosaminidase
MKKNILLIIIFIGFTVVSGLSNSIDNLMPVPYKIEKSKGKLFVKGGFSIEIKGAPSYRVENGIKEFIKELSDKTGMNLRSMEPNRSMKIIYKKKINLSPIMDETYEIKISKEGIILTAETDIGIIRGLQTLYQLLNNERDGYYFPFVKIKDKPRFHWRGLMIDVSRHFIPIDIIKKNIKGMSFLKMNVLHLHLSDDQGFRIECKSFPKLHLIASDGDYYPQEQMKEIIRFADERGIRVVPEFDMPAHTASWLVAYPELAAIPEKYKMIRTYGVKDPVMDPSNKKVYKFLKKFFKEMCKLFPDEYIHIGGDEVNGVQWKKSEEIKKFMIKKKIRNLEELQQYFNKKIFKILRKRGKKIIGWDEIYKNGMAKDVVIQSWRGRKTLYDTAKNGYYSILSNGYYIDLSQSAKEHYLNDPIPENSGLTKEEKKRILGGEATMWAELVSPENIDSRIWPRTAAIAERFWSPRRVKDVGYMYKRLKTVSVMLEEFGLTHIKNRDMILRRINGAEGIKYLKILNNLVVPLKYYKRHGSKEYDIFTPLTRFVDASVPDSYISICFSSVVDRYILTGDKKAEVKIIKLLKQWKDNYEKLEKTIEKTPILKEIKPLSKNLSQLSELALQAIEMKNRGKEIDIAFRERAEKIIEESKKPSGELKLAIVKPLEKIITSSYKKEVCVIKTNMGEMSFVFYDNEAPLTTLNFRKLIRDGFYNGKKFYRVVKGHVIQAGDGGENNYPTVKAEFNKNPHIIGAVGLARDVAPDSGSTEFYICVAPRRYLDGKYTVFGQLISGYDILKKIENINVKKIYLGKEKKIAFHTPVNPVIIEKIYIKFMLTGEVEKKINDILNKEKDKN